MKNGSQCRPARRPDERIVLAGLHRPLGLHLGERVRLEKIPPMFPLPKHGVIGDAVGICVLDPDEM